MTYNELKSIIKHLKKEVPCNSCDKKFDDNSIKVLSSYNSDAIFHFDCPHCKNQLIIHVSVLEQNEKESKINISAHKPENISKNDILDIHNFLSQFNGDFKKLFSTEIK